MPLMGTYRYLADDGNFYRVRIRRDFAEVMACVDAFDHHQPLPTHMTPRWIYFVHTPDVEPTPPRTPRVPPEEIWEPVIIDSPMDYTYYLETGFLMGNPPKRWRPRGGTPEQS